MDFRNILQDIEKNDPEVYERISPRRNVLKSFGAKVAVAALPLAIGSLFKKAYGKTTNAVIDALNFALELEYFEYTFYRTGTNTGGLIPAGDLPGFQTVQAHELAHINFLISTITTLGGTPFTPNHYSDPTTEGQYVPAAYDFTGGGAYSTVFSNYATFLMIASTFEDTTIRAYNGQLPTFMGTALFVQAQQILATEGRHASFVRLIRRNAPISAPELPAPWINNNIPPIVALQPNYLGEDNTQQLNVSITSLPGVGGAGTTIPQLSATAAFDEPMPAPTVMSLLAPYILP